MKGTKDRILLSLDGLSGDQMNEVLRYIHSIVGVKTLRNYDDIKTQALKEIRQALKPTNQLA